MAFETNILGILLTTGLDLDEIMVLLLPLPEIMAVEVVKVPELPLWLLPPLLPLVTMKGEVSESGALIVVAVVFTAAFDHKGFVSDFVKVEEAPLDSARVILVRIDPKSKRCEFIKSKMRSKRNSWSRS